MKRMGFIFLLGLMLIGLANCEKEAGPAGPIGPQGPAGADGSANVMIFNYPGFLLSDVATAHRQNIPMNRELFNKSMVLAYVGYIDDYQDLWYLMPGLSVNGYCEYRVFYRYYPTIPDSTEFNMLRIAGSGDDDIDSLRIIAIPATLISNKNPSELPDWRDQKAVLDFFDIKM